MRVLSSSNQIARASHTQASEVNGVSLIGSSRKPSVGASTAKPLHPLLGRNAYKAQKR